MQEAVTPGAEDGRQVYTFVVPEVASRQTPQDVIQELTQARDNFIEGEPAAFYLATYQTVFDDTEEEPLVEEGYSLTEIPSLHHLHYLACGCGTAHCGLLLDVLADVCYLQSVTLPERSAMLNYLPASRAKVMPHGEINQPLSFLLGLEEAESDQVVQVMTALYRNPGPSYWPAQAFPPEHEVSQEVTEILAAPGITDQVLTVALTLLETLRVDLGASSVTLTTDHVRDVFAAAQASLTPSPAK